MKTLLRTIRAFFLALIMTLKGEAIQPAENRYPALYEWVQEGLRLVNEALQVATQYGMDQAEREAFIVRINRRSLSMEVILQATRHNMTLEYPMLMDARIEHNLTTLYAMNLDDQYRSSELAAAGLAPEIKSAVQALADHLGNIPPSNQV